MRQDRAGDYGRIDIRVLLHIVRIHIPMELRELGPVRVTVAGRVTEDDGIPVQLAPAAQTVVTVGVVAAPFAVVPVLVLLPFHGGDDLAGGLWLGRFGYAGIFLFLMTSGGTDRRPHQHNGDKGSKRKSSDLFHRVFSFCVGRRHGSWVVNGAQCFQWRKRNSAEAGVVDRPPRCPLPVVELCLRMSALAAA